MSNIRDKTAIKAVEEQFINYGTYVNRYRHIPLSMDGLKPSYRRMIQTAFSIARENKLKSATIVGECIGHLHPHGSASLEPLISQLYHAGIFECQGNLGFDGLLKTCEMAAVRYTETKLASSYNKLFTPLMKYVPKFKNDLGYEEYSYLPVPIPLGLTFGYLGIGLGTGCRIPAFTPKSILDAYLNDDPLRLKNAHGLIIDNIDGLESLWTTGKGRIHYHIHNYVKNGRVYVEGFPGCVNPDFSKLMLWKSDGRVDYDDESSTTQLVSFYKLPRVQFPSLYEIQEEVEKGCKGSESYYIRVVHNNQVMQLGLRDWIGITYNNYIKLLDTFIADEINSLKFDIEFYLHFRTVADIMLKDFNISHDAIAKQLGIDIEIVNRVGGRTISSLRNFDPKNKVQECKNRINEYNSFDKTKYIKEIIDLM